MGADGWVGHCHPCRRQSDFCGSALFDADAALFVRFKQNYPNPFNSETVIEFAVPVEQQVHLIIYSILGQEIIRLFEGRQQAGVYRTVWDGTDASGNKAESGLYILQIKAGNEVRTRKMALIE